MNPLQPVQLEQVLPQVQLHYSDSVKPASSGEKSFAEALKSAQNESQNYRAEESSKTENNAQEESVSSVARNSESDRKNEPSDEKKLNAQEKSSQDKKESKIAKSENESEEKLSAAQIAALKSIQGVEEGRLQNTAHFADSKNIEGIQSAEESQDIINDRMLAWLMRSEKVQNDVEAAEKADDFAALIDAAIEFIPGNESEEEKLLNAQNLAISDPESFLSQVHQLADAELSAKDMSDAQNAPKAVSEAKSKKNDVKFAVHDLRNSKALDPATDTKAVQKAAAKREMVLSYQQNNESSMQMTMELAGKAETNLLSSNSQVAGATGSNFQAMLANAVQENAPEFVKAGNIVLKDNNSGTINIILKPEQLGNVKISLNLNDKVISGTINVQTREAMDAFKESIESLKQAFAESGFETGSFDLNFSSQQSFAQGEGGGQNQQASFLAEKSYGDLIADKVVEADSSAGSYGSGSEYNVNIVA